MVLRTLGLFSILLIVCLQSLAQVNLQTGSGNFSLPMFNWQDDKSRITSSVVLSYNSGNGLKVSELASNVGQGWNLVAGGVITRMQIGEPDDQMAYGNVSEFDLNKYPNGYLYASVPAANGCALALTKYPIYKSMNQVYMQHNSVAEDKQLDYFSFQFNGKAGIFVLDGATNKGVTLGDSKIIISFQRNESMDTHNSSGIRTTISSFTIQDVDGVIYKFARQGLSKILKNEYCDAGLNYLQKQPKFENGKIYHQTGFDNVTVDPWIIDNWYLTEIEDALTHRKVYINYTSNRFVTASAGEDVSFTDSDKDYCIISHKLSKTSTPDVSSIAYPDGHNVVFNYSSEQRADFPGQFAINSVDITYNSRYLSRYVLNTTYVIKNRYGTPVSAFQKRSARLYLKSVQKIGVDLKEDSPPYSFDYYLGSSTSDDVVPAPFSYAKDIWGFYNGANSKGINNEAIDLDKPLSQLTFNQIRGLCYLRYVNSALTFNYFNVKSGYAKNGLLKQIIYPTGGTLSFQYAQNSGLINGTSQLCSGVKVSQTSSTDGGGSNGCNNPLTTSYNYVLSDNSSSLWGLEMPVTSMTMSNHYQPEVRKYHWTWSSMPLGECYWKYQYPGILSQQQSISLPGWINTMNALAPVLGILNVLSTIKDIVTVCTGGSPVALIIDVILGLVQIALTCFGDNAKEQQVGIYYAFNWNSGNPLPSQFKRVEVVENPGTIGKTVQEFTNEDDYPLWASTNIGGAFSSRQRFAPWAYGLPKLMTVYDANGYKVKEIKNVYNFNTIFLAKCYSENMAQRWDRTKLLKRPLNRISTKCLVTYNTSQQSPNWTNPSTNYQTTSGNGIQVDTYDLYTGRTELDTTYERTFKPNDNSNYLENVTAYVYNDDNYEVQVINTWGSDAKKAQKNIYYTIDFVKTYEGCYVPSMQVTTNPEILALVQNNIISLPVETNEMANIEGSGNAGYTNDKATLFTTLGNGDIRPLKILEGRFDKPTWRTPVWPDEVTDFSYWRPGALLNPANPDYSFYNIEKSFTYDAIPNLVSAKDEGNRTVSNIYGYNNKYITASVINANPNEILFDGLEDNVGWNGTAAQYGWAISAFDNTKSHTGAYSARIDKPTAGERYCHSNTTLNVSLSAPTKYKYSGWVFSNGPSVDIYLFMKRASETGYFSYVDYVFTGTTGQWVFLEKEFTVPADVTRLNIRVDNNGGGSIWFDDIRLYPSKAQMASFTYDPLIGKTSESDVNNRVTYYEYDNLGRLKFIKDENRNAVKMYEYNNVSKQSGCPAVYYNNAVSEIFTKSNCGAGYIGGQVTYTIAANTYSSTISQVDADAQAENYLLSNGQNYANTNGSCIQLYSNSIKTQNFTTQTCNDGYKGGTVTYSVPAGRYTALTSQDADQLALDEIAANGQAYANDPVNAVCVVDTAADFVWLDGAQTYCANVNGQLPPHLFVKATNINPNSSTYNQTMWLDAGTSSTCLAGNYYNTPQSGVFTKNNCSGGAGSQVTYTVAAGSYSSATSLAAANQLAINDVNANGQNYANANGTCCSLSFNWASGVSYTYANVNLSGSAVNFSFVFNYTSGSSPMIAGYLAGNCTYPTATRTIPYTNGSSNFQITVSTNGMVQVQWVSGATPSGSYGFAGSYDLYVNSYYSAAQSGTFTKNNCPSGQVGTSVTYNVQAYKYRSTINQADADQLAQNDVNANGQNYANSQGTCTTPVTIKGSNSRSSAYIVQFTNGSFNQGFYISSGSNNLTLGTVPAGTYTVQIFMAGGIPPTASFTFGSYSSYYTTSASWMNVSVTSTTLATVF